MANEIYNAFVEAGLGREARTLSTTVDGKVKPAIGHYIAFVDNILDSDSPKDSHNPARTNPLYRESVKEILNYFNSAGYHKAVSGLITEGLSDNSKAEILEIKVKNLLGLLGSE